MQLLYDLITSTTVYINRQLSLTNFGDDYVYSSYYAHNNLYSLYQVVTTTTESTLGVNGSKYPDMLSNFLYSGQHWTYILSSWIGIVSSQLIVAHWGKNRPFDKKESLAVVGFMAISIIIAPVIDMSPIVSLAYGFVVQGCVKYAIDNGLFDKTQGLIAVGTINFATSWLSRFFETKTKEPNDKLTSLLPQTITTELPKNLSVETTVITDVKPVLEVVIANPIPNNTITPIADVSSGSDSDSDSDSDSGSDVVDPSRNHKISIDEKPVIGVKTERLGKKDGS